MNTLNNQNKRRKPGPVRQNAEAKAKMRLAWKRRNMLVRLGEKALKQENAEIVK